jgi:hypothetical protein
MPPTKEDRTMTPVATQAPRSPLVKQSSGGGFAERVHVAARHRGRQTVDRHRSGAMRIRHQVLDRRTAVAHRNGRTVEVVVPGRPHGIRSLVTMPAASYRSTVSSGRPAVVGNVARRTPRSGLYDVVLVHVSASFTLGRNHHDLCADRTVITHNP